MDPLHVNEQTMNGPREQKKSNEYLSLTIYSVVALALAFFIRFFIAAPYLVQGASMDATFHSNDYLIVDRISYRFAEPQRGDVIVFRYPRDPSRSFIKRVIGLPGETMVLDGHSVRVINTAHPDGFVLDEPYVGSRNTHENHLRITVSDAEYFVLGDNRDESADSRIWGLLPREDIIGRALVRLYPFHDININPGNATYQK